MAFTPKRPRRWPPPCRGSSSENLSRVKWVGTIGEYRIDWGPGYRIYLARDGDALVVLLGGGTKEREQADIERARGLWAEYRAQKAAAVKRKQKQKR